jgi:AcrR family transcriptional regulator
MDSIGDDRPTLREAQKQLTLAKLLDAARDVFHRKGYLAVTVDDIIDEAGVSRGTFYVYFRSKGEILSELFDTEHIAQVLALLESFPAKPTIESLRAWLDRYFRLYSEQRLTIRAWIQAGSRETGLRDSSLEQMDRVLNVLSEKIAKVRDEHQLSVSSEEIRVRALLMFVQMHEFAYYPYIRNYAVNESMGLSVLAELWYSAIFGLQTHPRDS